MPKLRLSTQLAQGLKAGRDVLTGRAAELEAQNRIVAEAAAQSTRRAQSWNASSPRRAKQPSKQP